MTTPVETFRSGTVKASVFEREVEGNKGKFTSQSIALQQSYQKDGEWVNKTLTIIKKNLQRTIDVLQQALDYCTSPAPTAVEEDEEEVIM